MTTLDTFTQAYLRCAFWVGFADDEDAKLYTPDNLAPEALAEIISDCEDFHTDHAEDIRADPEQAGFDFFLTRNRHGGGFWDGDWPREVGQRLTEAARVYGTQGLVVGDDGKVYLHN